MPALQDITSHQIEEIFSTLKDTLAYTQGDQLSLWKNRPACGPTHFCQYKYITYSVEKSSPIFLATFVIFLKLPRVNNRPMGENLPNLVTLLKITLVNFISLRQGLPDGLFTNQKSQFGYFGGPLNGKCWYIL
jgi:hypothetical protein